MHVSLVLGRYGTAIALCAAAGGLHAATTSEGDCTQRAADNCLHALALPAGAGQLRYYASHLPTTHTSPASPAASGNPFAPTAALIVIHGHSRDAGGSFNAALRATQQAGKSDQTVVVAPVFQVDAANAQRCSSPHTPPAQPDDATWTCGSWAAGALAGKSAAPISSFAALDALVADAQRQWPTLRSITLVGYSAGAQLLQHRIVFAAPAPHSVALRYVIAAPGSWLYLDEQRPAPLPSASHKTLANGGDGDGDRDRPDPSSTWAPCSTENACRFAFQKPAPSASCPQYNDWKYGLSALPPQLTASATSPRNAEAMRERYRAANIAYVVGADDNSASKAASYQVLDKSCAANLQGPFRLQRAVAFQAYDKAVIRPAQPRTLTIVPGCAHSATCVLPSAEMRAVLFP